MSQKTTSPPCPSTPCNLPLDLLDTSLTNTPIAQPRSNYHSRHVVLPGAFPGTTPSARPIRDSSCLTSVQDHTPSPPSTCSPPTPYTAQPREWPPSPSSPPGYATSLSPPGVFQPIQLLSLPPSPSPDGVSILGLTLAVSPPSYASPGFTSSADWYKYSHFVPRKTTSRCLGELLPSPRLPEPVQHPRPDWRSYSSTRRSRIASADDVGSWIATVVLLVLALGVAGLVVHADKNWGARLQGTGVTLRWEGRQVMAMDWILYDL